MEINMNCTNCQREIPDNIKFCPHCGQPVQINKPKRKSKKAIIALILVFVLAASLLGYKLYSSRRKVEDYDPILDYPFINGITYCEDGVIYVDTDLTDDTAPYILGTEDEELVDACSFDYLSTFSPYTDIIYYIADLEEKKTEVCGKLYQVNTKDLTEDADENRKRSKLIAENVSTYFVSSGEDHGVMYQNVEEEMYFYSDYGNEYLLDVEDIAYMYCIYSHENSHILLTLKEGISTSSFGIYLGNAYEMYHYDSSTNKLSIINDEIAFPFGTYNKFVYTKKIDGKTPRQDLYLSEITDDGIKTTKIDENIARINKTCITDEHIHISYEKEGDHPDDYTKILFTYDNGSIHEIGEIDLTTIESEYVTIFDYYESEDQKQDNEQYYTTGTEEVYKSPFKKIEDIQVAKDTGKVLVQAQNEDKVNCVYLCDVEYGKEFTNIQMIAYNACVSGEYFNIELFYVAGEKTRNLYVQGDDEYNLLLRDIPSDSTITVKVTPTIEDKKYYFVTNLLDFDNNSTIYDLYLRGDDKSISRVETMVEEIYSTGKGAVYTKNKALYYYGADTQEVEKIADSTYYYEVANKYEASVILSTYIY